MNVNNTNANTNANTNTVSKIIGLTAHDEKFKITLTIDFSDVDHETLIQWAMADRVIATQRALRECTVETLEEIEADGYKVHALNCGQKPKTKHETMGAIKALLAGKSEEEKAAILAEILG